ncbi:hypothetical protein EJB05_27326 [Eragrostis curvula]|uniref:Uncharacterized protein n=1 Tax=Eragrostis curvula TaxID=38414 RepID=A0A5J9UN80_9POAL|nr:hypothetical protein EJB05_27326 [Eragrostis curvula]
MQQLLRFLSCRRQQLAVGPLRQGATGACGSSSAVAKLLEPSGSSREAAISSFAGRSQQGSRPRHGLRHTTLAVDIGGVIRRPASPASSAQHESSETNSEAKGSTGAAALQNGCTNTTAVGLVCREAAVVLCHLAKRSLSIMARQLMGSRRSASACGGEKRASSNGRPTETRHFSYGASVWTALPSSRGRGTSSSRVPVARQYAAA